MCSKDALRNHSDFLLYNPLNCYTCSEIFTYKKFFMKQFFLAIAMLVVCGYVTAQATSVSTVIEKTNRDAVMISINQPLKVTTEALQEKLSRAGLKERVRRGAASYKGVILSEISKDKIDLYTKVEEGPNNSSNVYMAVSKGYNNFTSSGSDSVLTENVIAFLNSFVKDADNHFADLNISNQISDVNKSEKAYQKLVDEQTDLEKKKAAIEVRLAAISNELSSMRTDIDNKKTAVDESKAKRRE